MRRTILTLALCALASHAHAGRVYKCAAGGQTIYQTVPCPPEQDTGITRPITRDPKLSWEERSRAQRDLQAARQRMQADAGRGQPMVRGTVIDGSVDPEQCEDLRGRRELSEAFGRTAPPHVEAAIKKACARR
ncbi:DUF4124 domain-containing protein [Stenotrophomonas rhizophila]|uniref:DUF4124 domain-containing protein n=1 Tax=Stenotrophomonas rhizophila TaxID=216778 RepID=UPI001E292090|nr:DUF4124 domain-containing protein [Stenotrophomonas rhizophila]MCC7634950.1 DUF4124 domain-containing protein [Stenotrophomonas rhizophila]MCC7664267.1 DUF4124 domain-containing protein [Stenotrophomonas rhizophila]